MVRPIRPSARRFRRINLLHPQWEDHDTISLGEFDFFEARILRRSHFPIVPGAHGEHHTVLAVYPAEVPRGQVRKALTGTNRDHQDIIAIPNQDPMDGAKPLFSFAAIEAGGKHGHARAVGGSQLWHLVEFSNAQRRAKTARTVGFAQNEGTQRGRCSHITF